MPSNWLTTDSNLPTFTGQESVKEQLAVILEYMVTLTENLRYSLQNLGTDNWNDTELKTLTQKLTAGISQQMNSLATTVGTVTQTCERLTEGLQQLEKRQGEDAEDIQISLQKTAQELSVQVKQVNEDLQKLENVIRGKGGLAEWLTELDERIQQIEKIMQVDEQGVTLGAEGLQLRLTGDVYINGTLQEG